MIGKQIWYHGTDANGYKEIMKQGLAVGLYITPELSTALCMGGPYVFMFWHPVPEHGQWQTIITKPITEFQAVIKYSDELLYFNRELYIAQHRHRVMNENGHVCENCNGFGELEYPVDGHHLRISGSRFTRNPYQHPVVPCPVCKGYGAIKRGNQ